MEKFDLGVNIDKWGFILEKVKNKEILKNRIEYGL